MLRLKLLLVKLRHDSSQKQVTSRRRFCEGKTVLSKLVGVGLGILFYFWIIISIIIAEFVCNKFTKI